MAAAAEGVIEIGRLFQIVDATTEKTRLPILFSVVLGTKRFLETDDLRVQGISEKGLLIKRNPNYVGFALSKCVYVMNVSSRRNTVQIVVVANMQMSLLL